VQQTCADSYAPCSIPMDGIAAFHVPSLGSLGSALDDDDARLERHMILPTRLCGVHRTVPSAGRSGVASDFHRLADIPRTYSGQTPDTSMDTGHNPGPSGGPSAGRYRRMNTTLLIYMHTRCDHQSTRMSNNNVRYTGSFYHG